MKLKPIRLSNLLILWSLYAALYIFLCQNKNLAIYAGFHTNTPDAVFIDDEAYNHEFWQYMMARKKNKMLKCFLSLQAFETVQQDIALNTPIYIDLNLKGMSGLEVAQKLYERGFKNLYISTEFADFNVRDYPFIIAVISKAPPF